jgi:hypothetical protein
LLECCRLRVKDIDFATNQIVIRDGKGRKDRVTMLPTAVKASLIAHLARAREQHQADLRHDAGWVELPNALPRNYPNAGRDWAWQWVFPATRFYLERATGQRRRHHLHESVLQRAVKDAVRGAGIAKQATCHHLPTFVCDPPAGGEPRHPHRARTVGALRRQHHDDLHPRSQPRTGRRPQPRGPDVPVLIRTPGTSDWAAEAWVISRSTSRCITARKRRAGLQRRVNADASGTRPGTSVMPYRTMKPDIAVQDKSR